MNKKLLKQLVIESYTKEELDFTKVNAIADLLKRKDLKLYIRALRNQEKKKTVDVITPGELNRDEKKMVENTFKNKKINYIIDSSLIVGLKIIENDKVFDLNLGNTLYSLKEHIEQST